ncbi:hypothetical protein PINS_up009487 [Pythium insidiosum]|nr:hypothetical protein PINS_up009487 [Pythium insidiosum]
MAQRVWFALVDAETREAYAGIEIASLESEGITDAGKLREAIRKQYRDIVAVVASDLQVYANRVEYDKGDADGSLKADSPLASWGVDKEDPIIVVVTAPVELKLIARAGYPPFLKKAIQIANVMLTHNNYFSVELNTDKTTSLKLRDVNVEFRRPENGCLRGWTDRSASANTIYLNEVLLHRIEIIGQAVNSHEYKCIVFVVAATIFHECAHLALQWKNMLDSPRKFQGDAGDYMEKKVFDGICRAKVQIGTRAISMISQQGTREWTKEMPVLDVVIDGDELNVVQTDHLNKFFAPGNLHDKGLFPIERTSCRRTKGMTLYLDGERKRGRADSADPDIISPRLSGVSEDRYKRGKFT